MKKFFIRDYDIDYSSSKNNLVVRVFLEDSEKTFATSIKINLESLITAELIQSEIDKQIRGFIV